MEEIFLVLELLLNMQEVHEETVMTAGVEAAIDVAPG